MSEYTPEDGNNNIEENGNEITDSQSEEISTILDVNIEDVMKENFIDYAMSVIVSRALPDVRDGLKPVQRRILFAMNELGVVHNKPHKKSARIIGEVLGKYHPHGDSSIYGALVRMAQDFSYRHMLIDGHGNFGSIDGDGAAAMRYTEARMAKISEELLKDIDKNTVAFVPNFDGEETEPTVLPAGFPNLLVNGSTGIAVGMATNIPPHNLSEVIDGIVAYLKNTEITNDELFEIMKGPDFPTGALILGNTEIKNYFRTGRGKVRVRAKTHLEELKNGKTAIIVDEIPYMVNKAALIENIASLIGEKKIEGITEIRDESDKQGLRIYIEVRRDVFPSVVESQLFKYTALESTFGVNMIALVDGAPKLLCMKEVLYNFSEFRIEIVVNRSKFDLDKAERRAHILEGLRIALANIDEVVEIIKKSKDVANAEKSLIERFLLSEVQAKAILDMRLARLTSLEVDKLEEEYKQLMEKIAYLKQVIADRNLQEEIVITELEEIQKTFASPRRTVILENYTGSIDIEDMIINEDMMVILTHKGYIKRISTAEYKTQKRGGQGMTTANKDEDDFIEYVFSAKMLSYMLIFTDKGKCHWLKVYNAPEGSRISRGRPIRNYIELEEDEKIKTILAVDEFSEDKNIVLVTKKGISNKNSLMDYSRPRKSGILAIKIDDEDELLKTIITDENYHIGIGTKKGRLIHLDEVSISKHGRNTRGVRVIKIEEGDEVVGVIGMSPEEMEEKNVFTVTENGYGKMTPLSEYRKTNRGGKGVTNIKIAEKNGEVAGITSASEDDIAFIITEQGKIIKTQLTVRTSGRATQGVTLIKPKNGDKVMDIIIEQEKDTPENADELAENGVEAVSTDAITTESVEATGSEAEIFEEVDTDDSFVDDIEESEE